MSILSLLAPFLPGLIPKAKLYCLWLLAGDKWICQNAAGSSARRCKKARNVFIRLGKNPDDLIILPKAISPPAMEVKNG